MQYIPAPPVLHIQSSWTVVVVGSVVAYCALIDLRSVAVAGGAQAKEQPPPAYYPLFCCHDRFFRFTNVYMFMKEVTLTTVFVSNIG